MCVIRRTFHQINNILLIYQVKISNLYARCIEHKRLKLQKITQFIVDKNDTFLNRKLK